MDKLNVHDLLDEEIMNKETQSINNLKKQIKLLVFGSSFFLWPVSLIMIIATKFINNDLLFLATLFILFLMAHRVLKLAKLIKMIYNIYYLDGPYPPQRRNAFIGTYIFNIPLLVMCIYFFISGKYFWIIVPAIVISYLLFLILGSLLARSRENH